MFYEKDLMQANNNYINYSNQSFNIPVVFFNSIILVVLIATTYNTCRIKKANDLLIGSFIKQYYFYYLNSEEVNMTQIFWL